MNQPDNSSQKEIGNLLLFLEGYNQDQGTMGEVSVG